MPRVYIGRLSYHVREKDIQRFFSGYGRLLEVDLKNGYGFVEFEDSRDADDAVYELNGKDLCGERVIVEHARGPRRDRDGYSYSSRSGGGGGYSSRRQSGRDKYGPPVRTEYRLIVENLSSRCSWQDLKDFMRQAGEVTYADAHKERTNEGVIEFRSYSDMKRALDKLDGTEINGRKIRLVEDKPRSSHRRSYSGSHDLEDGLEAEVVEVGAAAAGPVVSLKVVPDLNPGHEAKTAHVPDLKAGNLDQRANQNPSLTGVRALTADPRRSLRSLDPGPGPGRDLPKKMVKEMLSLNPGQGVGLVPILHSSSHLPRLVQSHHPKELHRGPVPDLVQSLAHDQDLVQEIKTRTLLLYCTLLRNVFPTCQAINVTLVLQKFFSIAGADGLRTK